MRCAHTSKPEQRLWRNGTTTGARYAMAIQRSKVKREQTPETANAWPIS
jgi:hypothetical protein